MNLSDSMALNKSSLQFYSIALYCFGVFINLHITPLLGLQAFSTSQLHPQFTNSVYFVCTSLDELPDCTWNDDELYTEQVFKEILVALHWVKECAKNWPEVEWGAKDLSSLCVVVPNKHVVSAPYLLSFIILC